ncbi:MAG TPA: SRPBCC family protein, partial [Rubricoccaceae bacterium]
VLSDVPAWGALFPNVARIEPLPERDAFVWTMVPIGPPGVAVQTVYACRYTVDAAARTVAWTPIDGVGNARFAGRVALSPRADGGTDAHLVLDAVLSVPAPALLRPLVVAAVTHEFGRVLDTFASRLEAL